MRTFVIIGLLTILCTVCRAQVNFQPGYYIRNDGSRVSCLIKDYGWLNNPTDIVCKPSADDAPVTLVMDSITEFGVGNAKYRRFAVDVETSGTSINELANSPEPRFRHETAFLKVLVEGRASLYLYARKQMDRYFYRLNDGTPRPLVSKSYAGPDGITHVNQEFIRVLADSLACSAPDFPDPSSVKYEARSLARFFMAYNTCVKSAYTDYLTRGAKNVFHLYIRPGIDVASLHMTDRTYYPGFTFGYGTKTAFRIGAEAELVLAFNRNKWAVLLDPEYVSYQSSSRGTGNNVDYKAIQLLLGARYYMFLNPQIKLYLSAAFSTNFHLQSTVQYEGNNLNMISRIGGVVSGGVRVMDRFGLELQYQIPEDLIDNYTVLRTDLTTISVIFSFRIL